jgi:dipeptidyl aminopeptidase/acylaminoacyl peptidase
MQKVYILMIPSFSSIKAAPSLTQPCLRAMCVALLSTGILSGFAVPAWANTVTSNVAVSASANVKTDALAKQPSADDARAAASPKKAISHDVYANWRSIAGAVLSRDGKWAAYALVAQEGDGEVVVRNLQDGREWRSPRGNAPAFSADGSYLAFAIAPTRAELDQAKKDKKKGDDLPKAGLGIMDLASGKLESMERVKRYAWPEQGGNLLAVLLEPSKDAKKDANKDANKEDDKKDDKKDSARKKQPGTELLLIDAATAKRDSVKDVADFVWDKHGVALAYTVSLKEAVAAAAKVDAKVDAKADVKADVKADDQPTASKTGKDADAGREGVYLYTVADAGTRVLLSGAGHYKNLSFDDSGRQLAFVTNRDDLAKKKKEALELTAQLSDKSKDKAKESPKDSVKDKEPGAFALFYWAQGQATAGVIVNADTPGMHPGWSASEFADLSFSKDGQRLFFGTAELAKPEPKDAPEAIKVDLWHWKDAELQSMQKVKAEKEKQRSYAALWHVTQQRMVQLASKSMPKIVVNENAQFALGSSDLPYRMLQSWDSLYHDAYAVDLETGAARLLAKKLRFAPTLSPAGKYLLAFDADSSNWFSWSTQDGSKRNLTGKLKVHFEDISKDTPEPREAYGFAGWTKDDASVVLYDQYDLWEMNPATQLSRNLTQGYGRQHQLEMRFVKLDIDPKQEKKALAAPAGEPLSQPESKPLPDQLLLAATHEETRSSGYYQLNLGGGEPKKLLHAEKMLGGIVKARLADTVLFTQQSFTEFPDLWSADLSLQSVKKISAANPQQDNYNWGRQQIINYTSADGKKLKALLAVPENFDPSKKYPLMVYIYENMSDNLHKHIPPAPAQNINVTRYVSNGYVVLRPDIVYQTGYPGKSALNTVLPAIRQLIAKGYIDPKRVGIQGHSWGAYQINYLLTKTKMFRAAEAGASMANMVSGYGGIRWGTGMSRAFQYEKQQSRIGGTPWNSTAKFIENSPIFSIDKISTPYLTVHNDDDDAVPWYQAIEFFTALRRLDKEAYWFNYNGEKHGLKERDNIKHFTVHMSEFFDHYLQDKPRPEWMDKPVPYLEKGKRDVMGQFKPQ